MLRGVGPTELLIILAIVVIIFGVGRLPEVGGALGRSIRDFKKAVQGEDDKAKAAAKEEAKKEEQAPEAKA
ncbi:MAG: twin-arginine translocase TatA/TatE family subunit [Anaerolineae bacterium]|nr:twin-arginine translocase TatA/TatE family subunit [Anaerolineae bacterium]